MNKDWSKCFNLALNLGDLLDNCKNRLMTEEIYNQCMMKLEIIIDLAYENRVKEE